MEKLLRECLLELANAKNLSWDTQQMQVNNYLGCMTIDLLPKLLAAKLQEKGVTIIPPTKEEAQKEAEDSAGGLYDKYGRRF